MQKKIKKFQKFCLLLSFFYVINCIIYRDHDASQGIRTGHAGAPLNSERFAKKEPNVLSTCGGAAFGYANDYGKDRPSDMTWSYRGQRNLLLFSQS